MPSRNRCKWSIRQPILIRVIDREQCRALILMPAIRCRGAKRPLIRTLDTGWQRLVPPTIRTPVTRCRGLGGPPIRTLDTGRNWPARQLIHMPATGRRRQRQPIRTPGTRGRPHNRRSLRGRGPIRTRGTGWQRHSRRSSRRTPMRATICHQPRLPGRCPPPQTRMRATAWRRSRSSPLLPQWIPTRATTCRRRPDRRRHLRLILMRATTWVLRRPQQCRRRLRHLPQR